MNIPKVCNSAEFVNYVKPEVTMIEMEMEGCLLAGSGGGTGSGTAPGVTTGGQNTGSTIGGGGNETHASFSVNKSRVRR